jgi:hypothetical protein
MLAEVVNAVCHYVGYIKVESSSCEMLVTKSAIIFSVLYILVNKVVVTHLS